MEPYRLNDVDSSNIDQLALRFWLRECHPTLGPTTNVFNWQELSYLNIEK
jgi:hypothetical protein